MSPEQIDQNQIIAEINLIPEDKRKELYELIHKFRMDLERSQNNQLAIIKKSFKILKRLLLLSIKIQISINKSRNKLHPSRVKFKRTQ